MKEKLLPEAFLKALPLLIRIKKAGFEAYFVGGCVRDALLGRPIHDVDIATSAYPAEIKALFRSTIDIGIAHGTVLVRHQGESYEITTFRTESAYTDFRRPDQVAFVSDLSEDLKRRDFTVNALAMDAEGQITDLFGGLEDLKAKLLRAVGDSEARFGEDALRMLRALRFVATLGFEVEAETLSAISKQGALLQKISIERSFIEMDKLLLGLHWQRGLELLNQTQLYRYLPDFKTSQPSQLTQDFQFKNSAQAWSWLSLQFGELDLSRWKVSKEFLGAVAQLTAAYALENWDLQSVYRYGLATAQLVDDLKSARGLPVDLELPARLDKQLQIHDKSELTLSGADLLKLGYSPGPALGHLLKHVEIAVVSNQVKNTPEALLSYVRDQNHVKNL